MGEDGALVPSANPVPSPWPKVYCDHEKFPTDSGLNLKILLNLRRIVVLQVRATVDFFRYYV